MTLKAHEAKRPSSVSKSSGKLAADSQGDSNHPGNASRAETNNNDHRSRQQSQEDEDALVDRLVAEGEHGLTRDSLAPQTDTDGDEAGGIYSLEGKQRKESARDEIQRPQEASDNSTPRLLPSSSLAESTASSGRPASTSSISSLNQPHPLYPLTFTRDAHNADSKAQTKRGSNNAQPPRDSTSIDSFATSQTGSSLASESSTSFSSSSPSSAHGSLQDLTERHEPSLPTRPLTQPSQSSLTSSSPPSFPSTSSRPSSPSPRRCTPSLSSTIHYPIDSPPNESPAPTTHSLQNAFTSLPTATSVRAPTLPVHTVVSRDPSSTNTAQGQHETDTVPPASCANLTESNLASNNNRNDSHLKSVSVPDSPKSSASDSLPPIPILPSPSSPKIKDFAFPPTDDRHHTAPFVPDAYPHTSGQYSEPGASTSGVTGKARKHQKQGDADEEDIEDEDESGPSQRPMFGFGFGRRRRRRGPDGESEEEEEEEEIFYDDESDSEEDDDGEYETESEHGAEQTGDHGFGWKGDVDHETSGGVEDGSGHGESLKPGVYRALYA